MKRIKNFLNKKLIKLPFLNNNNKIIYQYKAKKLLKLKQKILLNKILKYKKVQCHLLHHINLLVKHIYGKLLIVKNNLKSLLN